VTAFRRDAVVRPGDLEHVHRQELDASQLAICARGRQRRLRELATRKLHLREGTLDVKEQISG
jgi:hypothetical protein